MCPTFEGQAEFVGKFCVHSVAFEHVFEFELTFVQVHTGVNTSVVARGRAARHVVCLFNEQYVEFEARKFSCNRATHYAAAYDENVGFLSVERTVFQSRPLWLLAKTFEFYVVQHTQRAFAHRRFAALVNVRPVVEFAREPYAPAIVLDLDGRGDFIDRPAYLCQIHNLIPLYLFFLF